MSGIEVGLLAAGGVMSAADKVSSHRDAADAAEAGGAGACFSAGVTISPI